MNNLDQIKDRIKRDYPGCVATQSYLRLEQNLQGAATTQIKFDVLQTDNITGNVQNPIENRLKVTDIFVATAVTLCIYKAGSSATASAVTTAERAKAALAWSANPGVFSTAGEAANLNTIYSGYLRLLVNRVVYFEALDTQRFKRAGDVQAGLITATGGVTTQQDNQPDANYGFVGLNPTLTIGGASQNDFSLNMPAATSLAGTSSSNFLVLYFRGFQVQGAAAEFERAQRSVGFNN